MHFTKNIVSLLAVAGFAAAQTNDLDRRDLEDFREQYLFARDEYIQARDLFRRHEVGVHKGFCNQIDYNDRTLYCISQKFMTYCKVCDANKAVGASCTCPDNMARATASKAPAAKPTAKPAKQAAKPAAKKSTKKGRSV